MSFKPIGVISAASIFMIVTLIVITVASIFMIVTMITFQLLGVEVDLDSAPEPAATPTPAGESVVLVDPLDEQSFIDSLQMLGIAQLFVHDTLEEAA